MARSAAIASTLVALNLLAGLNPAESSEKREVVAQDLKLLRAPGKVEAAIWTRRPEGYTLQVVLKFNIPGLAPMDGRRKIPSTEPEPPPLAQLRVWLLREDGSLIQPSRTQLPNPANAGLRTRAMDATYTFPENAGTEAVAVAMQVDGEFFIEKLESFGT